MDFLFDQRQTFADVIEFYCKYNRSAAFYLSVKVTSRDGNKSNSVWICYVALSDEVRQTYEKEWNVPMTGDILEGGWTAAKISIADDVNKSFGNDGWVYNSIECIRLRGSLSISSITFYKIG